MTADPDQQKFYDVAVRDFGSGPCLATVGAGATIVLTAFVSKRGGKCEIRACSARGVLEADAGNAVLADLAVLWNERARVLRATRMDKDGRMLTEPRDRVTPDFRRGDRVRERPPFNVRGVVGIVIAIVPSDPLSMSKEDDCADILWEDGLRGPRSFNEIQHAL